jgi:hypothetical protein
MELWLKRYLSLFFDFEYFGNLNWLAIPLLIYFLVTIKKRKRWEMAIAFVFIISCLLLEIRGGFWPRYIFTLYPFTLAAIFLLGWEHIKKKSSYLQIGILIICGIFVFYNYYHYKDTYNLFWRTKASLSEDNFPHKTIEIINNIKAPNSVFLICSHRHLFFYHTNKKGIDYRDPKLGIFYSQKNKEAALDVLKNQLKVKYILLYWNYKPTLILMDIISNYCDLIYRDKKFYFYRIREKKLDKEELESLFINDSLLKNGSFENWTKDPLNNPDYFKARYIIKGKYKTFKGAVIKEEKEIRVGRYSIKITGDSYNFEQDLPNFEKYKGKQITCFVWVKTNVANKYRIQIHDGIDSSTSKKHSGRGGWELLQANHTVNPSAKLVRVRVIQAVKTGKPDAEVFIDGALLVEGYWNTYYLYKLHMEQKNLIEELSQK